MFKSRKFVLALLTLASVTLLVAFRRIDGGVYATVIVATVGAYMTAHVVQKKGESSVP